MTREYANLIVGQEEAGSGWLDIRSPYSGEKVGAVALADAALTGRAIDKMAAGRVRLSRHERYRILNAMSQRLSAEIDEVSRLISLESGLSLQDTTYEVGRACDVLMFSAIQSLQDDSQVFPCDVSPSAKPRRIYTTRHPLRLVCAITPFNHPLNQVVHKVAPAIAAGAPILLKPSQLTPLSAHYIARLAYDCGLPPEMLSVINCESAAVAESMITNPLVEMVTFTGSTAVGKRIAGVAAYKRIVLEMGGSSAMLVLEDADPEKAAELAAAGIFKNSGQRCTAIRRLLVHESLADRFAESLAHKAEQLRFGNPMDPATQMGTVISEKAAMAIEQSVEQSIAEGARLIAGHTREGALYAPTVLDNVSNETTIARHETFGPVAPIIRFQNLNEAIEIANDTEFGLSGAVVSDHWPSIQRVISDLETGTVNVNEIPGFRLECSPFGGIKSSGLGYKEGVIEAAKSMTYIKTYSLPWDRP
ncbi:MAG: aldehyde dehydrogenase family protein [Edaphobacter sp.]|uniref:aldehyde dehydrogenase family protein n=1 Tax=Edaphobacter sp. TaxID=1934404 RepID=UPI00239D9DE0|nr:aldehyde dehydrogenase family protein [Edaphobacter sp.]MDE1177457.1 aldehyde dehydrogenase family protein [Edaphobacter sp.]